MKEAPVPVVPEVSIEFKEEAPEVKTELGVVGEGDMGVDMEGI